MTDDQDLKLKRLKKLAGLADGEKVIILLPRGEAENTRDLLDRLKKIAGDDSDSNWTEVTVNGERYWTTGVVRDLP